eukprot:RCo021007
MEALQGRALALGELGEEQRAHHFERKPEHERQGRLMPGPAHPLWLSFHPGSSAAAVQTVREGMAGTPRRVRTTQLRQRAGETLQWTELPRTPSGFLHRKRNTGLGTGNQEARRVEVAEAPTVSKEVR